MNACSPRGGKNGNYILDSLVSVRCGSLADMFETESFKNQLTAAISAEAANNNLEHYEPGIVDYLQGLASENESTLMDSEVRKIASARRGTPAALNSAKELAKEACKYASADKRTLLKLSDIQTAYRAKFCQFWPFCKS